MIDKSLSYKYSAENRKGFFRGAQADAAAGRGDMSPGTSASGGSRNGGGNGRSIALANQYVEPVIIQKDEPIIRHHAVDTPTQIKEQIVLDQIREKEKEQLNKDWDHQDAKAKAPTTLIPKTKTVTYKRGNPFTIYDQLIPTTVKSTQTLYDPRTSQNALLDRGS